MNRIQAAAGLGLAALLIGGAGEKYVELSNVAATPAPSRDWKPKLQLETTPVRAAETVIASYLASVATDEGGKAERLASLLAAVETPEFDGEEIEAATAEALARSIVAILEPGEGGEAADLELKRRAVGFLAGRVPGKTSKEFVLKAMEEGPAEIRVEAIKRAGYATGVRGASVYAKVKELGEKGLVPDSILPSALRRTGGIKAKDGLVALMGSTDNAKLITGCAISLQDYRDPELIGAILERLEQVGMLDSSSKMPWLSPALLDEHLKSADKQHFRRGMMAMAARPSLVKQGVAHVEKGLQSPDADSRRYAAVAVKKATVAKVIDAKQGETLLAGRLEVETEPVLKAEITGGLERVRSVIANTPETGVQ